MRESKDEPVGRFVLLVPKLAQRIKPEPRDEVSLSRPLRVLSCEAVLKRFTAPKVRISSLVNDLLAPRSTEGVGVRVCEEEPELEVEKRLNGRRRG